MRQEHVRVVRTVNGNVVRRFICDVLICRFPFSVQDEGNEPTRATVSWGEGFIAPRAEGAAVNRFVHQGKTRCFATFATSFLEAASVRNDDEYNNYGSRCLRRVAAIRVIFVVFFRACEGSALLCGSVSFVSFRVSNARQANQAGVLAYPTTSAALRVSCQGL